MSLFNPSRGTGSFGKSSSTTPIGSFPFNVVAAQSVPTASTSTSAATSASSRQQRASSGNVQSGRTGTGVSRSQSSSSSTSSAPKRGIRRASKPVQKRGVRQASKPTQKRGIVVDTLSWGSPLSTFSVVESTRAIRNNEYQYFPINKDSDLHQVEIINWRNFGTIISPVKMPTVETRFYSGNSKPIADMNFFDVIRLNLGQNTPMSQINMAIPQVERNQIPFQLKSKIESDLRSISKAAFDKALPILRSSKWRSGSALAKCQYLIALSGRLRGVSAKESLIISDAMQLFIDSHFMGYRSSNYDSRVKNRYQRLGIILRPLDDRRATSARNALVKLWGNCAINPKVNNDVRMPTYSTTTSVISGGKIILRNNPSNFMSNSGNFAQTFAKARQGSSSSSSRSTPMSKGMRFPMGDFVSMLASRAYLHNAPLHITRAMPSMKFSRIYKATSSQKSGYIKTLGLFTNAITVLEKYAGTVGRGGLTKAVIIGEFEGSRRGHVLEFLKRGSSSKNLSLGIKTQNRNLGQGKSSNRFIKLDSFLSTLFIIDVLSCKQRSALASINNIGGYNLQGNALNFLKWIPKRARYVAQGGASVPQASSKVINRREKKPTGRRPFTGVKSLLSTGVSSSGKGKAPTNQIQVAPSQPSQGQPSSSGGSGFGGSFGNLTSGLQTLPGGGSTQSSPIPMLPGGSSFPTMSADHSGQETYAESEPIPDADGDFFGFAEDFVATASDDEDLEDLADQFLDDMQGPVDQEFGLDEQTPATEGSGANTGDAPEYREGSPLHTMDELVKDLDLDTSTASGDALADAGGKSKTASDSDEEKTSYTPWIIGGVTTVAVGIGVFMYVNNKKKAI